MGNKHRREDILAAAIAASVEDGIGSLSYGRLAKRLGINDRMIVYYFPTKGALLEEVLEKLGGKLQKILLEAFEAPASGHLELAKVAWPYIASPEADPTFRIFFESVGLALRGLSPFEKLVPETMHAWMELLKPLLDVPEAQKQAEAEATVALMDGLILLRQVVSPEAARRAARALGVA